MMSMWHATWVPCFVSAQIRNGSHSILIAAVLLSLMDGCCSSLDVVD
jgi:hypothetical protein|eukprot:COSAG06_NODE_1841_length_8237_cov_11.146965_8_plen_47_part_00